MAHLRPNGEKVTPFLAHLANDIDVCDCYAPLSRFLLPIVALAPRYSLSAQADQTRRSAMRMQRVGIYLSGLLLLLFVSTAFAHNEATADVAAQVDQDSARLASADDPILDNAEDMIEEGRRTFRFDTFGDEDYWGGQLQLHQAIQGASLGGVGPGVSPNTALSVGLKVDADALPRMLRGQLKSGRVNLDDPATTLALLQLDAVVGVTGIFDDGGNLRSIGIQCALCHSTVNDSLAPGIGRRLDGCIEELVRVTAARHRRK